MIFHEPVANLIFGKQAPADDLAGYTSVAADEEVKYSQRHTHRPIVMRDG